jgi:hypothetical protein
MKNPIIGSLVIVASLFAPQLVKAQGTFIVDQQSTNIIDAGAPLSQSDQPTGQSFTPALSTVGFVMLYLFDAHGGGDPGATVYVDLRSGSITGTLLGSTAPEYMPAGFSGITDFPFLTPIAVNPGTQYYFQPIIQTGDNFTVVATDTSYTGGSEIANGVAIPVRNLWFQEGIVAAPEPSSSLLLLLGTGILFYARRRK